ncbi:dephospho-CoA kinase [Pseudodesulfovibrio senegalensis]|uniref:Dephospho-CoA kinase n=1 Tax=Pseudodesulfovibrio senegalensis TaxID=1721087 RepID=A0A6N6N768_9BACT|nr:dephospho-CoA kinase [Pseudodesulfovibrio senegalensis]KAB1443285.1 dephospho-CoA kinase [Pseudodesulfovibrio senegalensis]
MIKTGQKRHWQIQAGNEAYGMRLDKFWAGELAEQGVSRGRVRDWIESGHALVDGAAETRGKRKLAGTELLELAEPADAVNPDAPQPESGPLPVLFEDDCLLVIDKPAGLTTHPAPGCPDNTLVNRLLHHWPDIGADRSGMDPSRPGIVHRLDKGTSGLIAVARTEAARLTLASDFAERRVSKVYLAIVHGRPEPPAADIDAPMGRHPSIKTRMAVLPKGGREARSRYRTLWTDPLGRASLVAVRIFTGRTHQIRVHMAHVGHPLLGDTVYGDATRMETLAETMPDVTAERQMLHAFWLRIAHPESGETMRFLCEPPEDFMGVLRGLGRICLRVGLVGMPGCGKSTVLGVLRSMSIAVFSADECVAELYEPGHDGAEMIRGRFGGRYSLENGGVNKPSLFAAMLEDDAVRREVMDMVHPMVKHACEKFFEDHAHDCLAVAEVPLLLEGGWHDDGVVDEVVYVDCPDELRTGPFRESRGLAPETLAAFDSWQWPAADKRACCAWEIRNHGDRAVLESETRRVVRELREAAADRGEAHEQWLERLWPQLAEELDGES